MVALLHLFPAPVLDVVVADAVPHETVDRALDETLRNHRIEAAHHEAEPQPLSVQGRFEVLRRHVHSLPASSG